ncbi:hypothetical protein [Tautonia sociabilis]|uniref:Uncharacterized protein n=1 Tax=Tautonia sociabilis TaxID=2080755 RepID=A0A432MHC9_9BACT|nr:hypothetical protein [Tautonia sociabilis]RUL86182.1 hypothetical protein TsocGM_16595 [Tautonia sociabilis]
MSRLRIVKFVLLFALLPIGGMPSPAPAQDFGGRIAELERAIEGLESDVCRLRSDVEDLER